MYTNPMSLRYSGMVLGLLLIGGCRPTEPTPTSPTDTSSSPPSSKKSTSAPAQIEEKKIGKHGEVLGKLEQKELPRGAEEIVATVAPENVGWAKKCLDAEKIQSKTHQEKYGVDIIVETKDSDRAGAVLRDQAANAHIPIHVDSQGQIKPDMKSKP